MANITYPIFIGPGGSNPAAHIRSLAGAVQATIGDALYAGQILRTRIRQRTANGVDVDGVPFVPYSEAYRKRKIALLGHADTVDLFGPRNHPHMLNAMLVRCESHDLPHGSQPSPDPWAAANPTNLFHLGYYGEEAVRGRVHNEGLTVRTRLGTGKRKPKGKASYQMPRRRHLDANRTDVDLMGFAIRERMLQRAGTVKP